MSFQWIINKAESLSIDRQPVVGQTITRNQTVRATSRGSAIWKFTVTLPSGLRWVDIRTDISKTEALGRTTTGAINLSTTGHSFITAYQGNSNNFTGFVATITKGASSLTLTTSPTTSSGFKFKAGDFIQITSTGNVYTVAADVAFNSNTVTLNRPIDEASGTAKALIVGPNVSWTVICVQYPSFTIVEGGRVVWSGPFVFYENRV